MTLEIKFKEVKIPKEKYKLKCPYPMEADRIVIHNTANSASALEEAKFSSRNDWEVSSHFYVDEKDFVKSVDINRNAWHSGDGDFGCGNRKGICIEICRSTSDLETFQRAERNGAILTAYLLKEKNWDITKISKHQDYSGKYCPHKTLDLGWDRFLDMVKSEYNNLERRCEYALCYFNDGDQALAEAMLSVIGKNNILAKTTDASHIKCKTKIQIGAYPIKDTDIRLAGENRMMTLNEINKWSQKTFSEK